MSAALAEIWHRPPQEVRLHFLGVCGIGMGQLAIELKRLGYCVTGADGQCDPPMSEMLARAGIEIAPPGSDLPRCDIIIVGRLFAQELPPAASRETTVVSYPELLAHCTRGAARRWVVAGTKGKTTTTTMLAWIAEQAGLRPDYLIGGVPGCLPCGLRLGESPVAIFEGDEYPSAPHDLTPKFLHYRPTDAVLTNIFPDHADVFPDFGQYRGLFSRLIASLPAGGTLVAAGDRASGVTELPADAPCRVVTVGFEENCAHRITGGAPTDGGMRFDFLGCEFALPVIGRANALDAALATVAAQQLDVSPARCAEILQAFVPVNERLQKTGEPGGVHFFIDNSAHPDALASALASLRERFPGKRLLCIVQPQSPGAGDGYAQRRLSETLCVATHVLVAPIAGHAPEAFDPPFSCDRLVDDLVDRGVDAAFRNTRKTIVAWIAERAKPGDVLLLAVHPPSRASLQREISAALEQPANGIPA